MAQRPNVCILCMSERHQEIKEGRRMTIFTDSICIHENAKPLCDVIDGSWPTCLSLRESADPNACGHTAEWYERDPDREP